MKKLFFLFLFLFVQFIYAQDNWAIVDNKTYSKNEFDSLMVVLKQTALDTVKKSIVKYSGRPEKCLCVEFYYLTLEGTAFTRDCGDIFEVYFSDVNGVLTIIRENNKIESYWVYDPFTWLPVEKMESKYVSIFEIDRDKFNQGQKFWTTYSDGSPFK